MVEFNLKIHPKQRTTYWPRQIVDTFGTQLKFLPNREAGLIYRKDADPRLVLASLDLIRQDLQLMVESKKNKPNFDLKIKADPATHEGGEAGQDRRARTRHKEVHKHVVSSAI